MAREMGGRTGREETWVYLWLILVDVWQQPTQHCKANILQLKISKKKNEKEINTFSVEEKTKNSSLAELPKTSS